MAQCVYCGAETALMVNGVPVCVKCDDKLEAEKARKTNNDKDKDNGKKRRR